MHCYNFIAFCTYYSSEHSQKHAIIQARFALGHCVPGVPHFCFIWSCQCHRRRMLTVLLQRLMRVLMQYIDALSLGTLVFWCVRI